MSSFSVYPTLNLLILTLLLLLNYSAGQTLTVERSFVTLPSLSAGAASVYDGDDTIYIFGGSGGGGSESDKILKYSISADNVTIVSQFPWGVAFGSILAGRTNTSYFYIGGDQRRRDSTDIFEFNAETMVVTLVGNLPYSQFAPGAVKIDRDTGLIVTTGNWVEDSDENEILKFDLETLELTRVTGLLVDYEGFTTIRDPFTGNVWIFGLEWPNKNTGDRKLSTIQPVEKYNPSTNLSEVLYLDFPQVERLVSLTSDGLSCYLIGGYAQADNATIFQFNPLTHSLTPISVAGFPGDVGSTFSTSSVYVRKLNRIYMIGGDIIDSTGFYARDEILWMDLSPLKVQ